MKKRNLSLLLVLIMVASLGLAAGCGTQGQSGSGGSELSGSITIAGSTSVQPFSEVLAEEFMAKNNQATIYVQGGGSSQGIEAAVSGVADIGASSRELKADEESSLHKFVIARDGIAVVVHPSNQVSDLSLAQLHDIFAGKISNWNQVGGPDSEINLVSREAGSGTRDGFESLVMNDDAVTDKALVANSTGAVKTTVAGDKNAIGYISLAALDSTVKLIAIDGIKPTSESILSGQYKIQRPFIYVTREEPTGLTKTFIDFVLSDAGQKLLEEEGAIRIN